MPSPTKSELKDKKGQNHYISRCVVYVTKNEGLSQDKALGKCYGMYKEAKKRKKSKANIENHNSEPEWIDPETDLFKIRPE